MLESLNNCYEPLQRDGIFLATDESQYPFDEIATVLNVKAVSEQDLLKMADRTSADRASKLLYNKKFT